MRTKVITLVTAGVLALMAAPTAIAATPAILQLPPPSGPHQVGRTDVHLTDPTRPDPLKPGVAVRELMVSVWYPARDADRYPVAPQQLPGAARAFGELAGRVNYGVDPGMVDWAATQMHAHWNAPIDRNGGRKPVVLYSPGAGDPRDWNTTLVEDLASHGYVVITIDSTYEAFGLQFPGNRVARSVIFDQQPTEQLLRTLLVEARVADTRFVLDRLEALPPNLRSVIDLGRIGMVGQSGGGFTALQAMHDDPRIKAAVDLDGQLNYGFTDDGHNQSAVATDGLDRPYLLFGTEAGGHAGRPSWNSLWLHSTGWHRDLLLAGAREGAFTDAAVLLPEIGMPEGPAAATNAKREYVAAFLDRFLNEQDDHLLDGPSPAHPEVTFVG